MNRYEVEKRLRLMLDVARAPEGQQVERLVYEVTRAALFESAFSTEAIEHTEDPLKDTVEELARVLARGGTPFGDDFSRLWHRSIRLANAITAAGPHEGLENWIGWNDPVLTPSLTRSIILTPPPSAPDD